MRRGYRVDDDAASVPDDDEGRSPRAGHALHPHSPNVPAVASASPHRRTSGLCVLATRIASSSWRPSCSSSLRLDLRLDLRLALAVALLLAWVSQRSSAASR
jgi:hypothetical protein